MAMKFYVCCPENTVEGPISPDRIRAWRRDGQIDAATLVSNSREGGWICLGEVPELMCDTPEEIREQARIASASVRGPGNRIPTATSARDRATTQELTGFHWHTRIRVWLSGLAVLAGCFGEYIPVPGGSVFASMGAFLWSANPDYMGTPYALPIDLRPYYHWIPIYLGIGLGFWPLLGALRARYSDRMGEWACVALGFLLLDVTMTTVINGFVIIPGIVSPLRLLVVGGLLVGAYRMNFDALLYFYRFQRNSKRRVLAAARPLPQFTAATPPPTAPKSAPSAPAKTANLDSTQSPEAGVPRP